MSKMVARLLPHYEFDIDDFFRSDGAPAEIASAMGAPFKTPACHHGRHIAGTAGKVRRLPQPNAARNDPGNASGTLISGCPCNRSGSTRFENP